VDFRSPAHLVCQAQYKYHKMTAPCDIGGFLNTLLVWIDARKYNGNLIYDNSGGEKQKPDPGETCRLIIPLFRPLAFLPRKQM
jgi:hypothetical protein